MNAIEQLLEQWQQWKESPGPERLLTGELLQVARTLSPQDWSHLPSDLHDFIRLSDEQEWEQAAELLSRAPANGPSQPNHPVRPSSETSRTTNNHQPASNTAELIAAIQAVGTHLSCKRTVPDNTAARLHHAVEGARERGFVALGLGGIEGLAISPNNQWAAVACGQGTVVLLDRAGRVRHQWQAYEFAAVRSIAFGPSGQIVVTGGSDGSVNVWTLEGTPIGSQQFCHEGAVLSVAVSPEGDRIASSGTDFVVHLWPMDTYSTSRQSLPQFQSMPEFQARALEMAHRGEELHIQGLHTQGYPEQIHQGNNHLGGEERIDGYQAQSPQTLIRALQFEPHDRWLIGGGSDGRVHLWDWRTGQLERSFDTRMGAIASLSIDRNGERLVCGSRKGELWVQSMGSGTQHRWQAASQPITAAIPLANRQVVTSSGNAGSTQWDSSGRVHRQLQGEDTDPITAAAVSPCGNWMICGTRLGVVRLWDLRELDDAPADTEHHSDRWQHWLHIACDRLQYHPALSETQSASARSASRVCSLYGYQDLGGTIPLHH
ncbi:MAG: hypothetical protein AAF268_09255 [Cyanobacteria bacterium P01_A01_bin.3]